MIQMMRIKRRKRRRIRPKTAMRMKNKRKNEFTIQNVDKNLFHN